MDELYDDRKKRVLEVINDDRYKPLKIKELCYLLGVAPEDRGVLVDILNELIAKGKVIVTEKGKYMPLGNDLKSGVYEGNAKGFGFIVVEDDEDDYFVPENASNGALHKDTVLFKVVEAASGKRKEAHVVRVIDRGYTTVVGTYEKSKAFGFVVPDSQKYSKDIFIAKKDSMGAVTGHKVVVKLTNFGGPDKKPEGRVIEIIGHINDPGTDVLSVAKAYGLDIEFNDEVMAQIESIPDDIDGEDISHRVDFRNKQTVTIDGEDAKDLDDAITIERDGEGYILGVHIADVSNYVREGSALDKEALKRGTSTYLVDRVIPMLPHKLSNGICSLNQGVDRLALSCIMEIDKQGKVIDHTIAETVINVDRRMTYTAVQAVIDGDEEATVTYSDFKDMFMLMEELANILRKKRHQRGSIDFDFPEAKIILDEEGKPIDIHEYDRNSATKIIEDFMLIANETVAEDYYWQEIPFEYRNHEAPDPEKVEKLSVFINNFGLYFKASADGIHPKEFQKLLEKIEGTPNEPLISRLTLRSMKQAKYTTVCSGHFGLSTKYYCHFTSPIRRYPDLQIHRIIKENLQGKLSVKRIEHYTNILPKVADANSKCERTAEEAEREVIKLKKVQYMADKIGESYEGVISGISNWGMFVELPNTVEGLIHVTSMIGDYYYYDEENYAMVGRDSGKRYVLGQKLRVIVNSVDRVSKTIDFGLDKEEESW